MGYSRATFVKFAAGEDAATLCTGLREAFDYFGGVPEHVLFDNMKAVVIERGRRHQLQGNRRTLPAERQLDAAKRALKSKGRRPAYDPSRQLVEANEPPESCRWRSA
jgi:transposase